MTASERVDHATGIPPRASWSALCGVVGAAMLGSSFGILPAPPAVTAPLDQLVAYANHHHDLLLLTAWLEAAGSALFVVFLVSLASMDAGARRTSRLLTVLCGAAVLAVGLVYAVSLIAIADSAEMGGPQLLTTVVAYGLWAACEHAFLIAPPVLLPLGFALRGSTALSSRFSDSAIALGCTSIVLGLVGLLYARPQNAGAAGVAINVLIGLEVIWVAAAAVSLHRRRLLTHSGSSDRVAEEVA